MPGPFIVDERPVPRPATHVIVIGVGKYPHLPGGGGAQVPKAEGMRQLTSPPISARAFATWVIEHLYYPDKPLASVALLVSEAEPTPFFNPSTGEHHQLEVPTIANLRAALRAWRTRGARANDRLIFFFCGHGMGKGSDTALLAADYGVDPDDPLDAAIDFRNFLLGMSQMKTEEQVYFVDACRVHSGSLLRTGVYNGRPIITPDVGSKPNQKLRAPVYYSTLAGAEAFGQDGKPSIFTTALLHAFAGAGANDDKGDGDWRVTALGLQAALNFHLERAVTRLGRTQVPAADNAADFELQFIEGIPTATAIVYCDPVAATRAARFGYVVEGNLLPRPGLRLGEWMVELPADEYEFRAEFPRGRWKAQPVKTRVRPISKHVKIRAFE